MDNESFTVSSTKVASPDAIASSPIHPKA
jgi:hypothetical protein